METTGHISAGNCHEQKGMLWDDNRGPFGNSVYEHHSKVTRTRVYTLGLDLADCPTKSVVEPEIGLLHSVRYLLVLPISTYK